MALAKKPAKPALTRTKATNKGKRPLGILAGKIKVASDAFSPGEMRDPNYLNRSEAEHRRKIK